MARKNTKKKKKAAPKRRRRKSRSLFGIATTSGKPNTGAALKETGLNLLALGGGGVAGAAIGKNSLLIGLPLTFYGYYKKNPLISSAGMGLILCNGFQSATQSVVPSQNTNSVEGLDMKQIAAGAKERVNTFIRNFSEKLYLKPVSLNSLNGTDQVSYFMTPFSGTSGIDMSDLDRIQVQIAEMSNTSPAYSPAGQEAAYQSDSDFEGINF